MLQGGRQQRRRRRLRARRRRQARRHDGVQKAAAPWSAQVRHVRADDSRKLFKFVIAVTTAEGGERTVSDISDARYGGEYEQHDTGIAAALRQAAPQCCTSSRGRWTAAAGLLGSFKTEPSYVADAVGSAGIQAQLWVEVAGGGHCVLHLSLHEHVRQKETGLCTFDRGRWC